MQISNTFSTGVGLIEYRGPVVACPEALFLVPVQIMGLHEADVLDGIVDNAVAGFSDGLLTQQADDAQPMACDISELPTIYTEDPGWPLKGRTGKVVIVPREAVVRIFLPFMGKLQVFTQQKRFNVNMSMFGRGKARNFLRHNGWQL